MHDLIDLAALAIACPLMAWAITGSIFTLVRLVK